MTNRSIESGLTKGPETGFTGLSAELGQVVAPEVEAIKAPPPEQRVAGLTKARENLAEAVKEDELGEVLRDLDFSDPRNFQLFIADSYHGQAATGASNTRSEGRGRAYRSEKLPNGHTVSLGLGRPHYSDADRRHNQWGDPIQDAHLSGQAIEKVGIRAEPIVEYEDVPGRVRADGLKGKLGFTKAATLYSKTHETDQHKYIFDYAFAAPANGEAAAQAAGNHTGQNIELSIGLTEEQAHGLSRILAEDPTAARAVLDNFVEQTGDKGKWEAELYDDAGNFYDPGERYGTEHMVARDVRPNYDAVPDLKPQIIGLLETDK